MKQRICAMRQYSVAMVYEQLERTRRRSDSEERKDLEVFLWLLPRRGDVIGL